jgi:hypothetical protein
VVQHLRIDRADTAAAASGVVAAIREEIPTASDVTARVEGELEQRTLGQAMKTAMAETFADRFRTAFAVIADARTPRPVRIWCGFVAVSRGAVVGQVRYETRLHRTVPSQVTFRRDWIRSSGVQTEPALRSVLGAAGPLRREIGKFLRPKIMIGNAILNMKPALILVPDDDGAIVVASAVPRVRRSGFGQWVLDLATFLDIADGLDATLARAPGSVAVGGAAVPLPEWNTD